MISDAAPSLPVRTAIPAGTTVADVLSHARYDFLKRILITLLVLALVGAAFVFADVLNVARYRDAYRTILTLASDAVPPDFSRWRSWGQPLLDTLAMCVSGTALGAVAGTPLAVVAARNAGPHWLRWPTRAALAVLRSIPTVVWGIMFVAAVGFGPLPGALAMACQSTGVLGKLYSEVLEHVDPAPGDALRSHGVGALGVLRFSVLPQILPRAIDATFYRLEQNMHAATIIGLVGGGGIGLQIATAFHLFAYREALALILVLLAIVLTINLVGSLLRARFLGRPTG